MTADTPAAAVAPAGARRVALRTAALLLLRYGMVVVLVVLVLVITALDSSFFAWDNLLNILLEWAPVGVMAVAMTFVVIAGGFDLSVGGTFAVSSVIFAKMAVAEDSVVLAILACLAVGMLIGLANGLIVTRMNVNPFVATLGTGYIVRGLGLVITGGIPITFSATGYLDVGTAKLLGVPLPVVVMVAVFVIGGLILKKTIYGKHIYAVGGSQEASRLSGLRTDALRTSTYIVSGMAAAIAGIILAARLGAGQGDAGVGIELTVITVVLAGGIALSGGEGAVWRAAVGLGLLAVISNAFDRLQISTFWASVVTGAILVIALALDAYGKRRLALPARGEALPGVAAVPTAP
jgi:ribose transport system permease protein